jgi:23S rRNA pseudouridine2605 synthase
MRLNQYVAKHTGISRRKADEQIQNGRVRINGELNKLGSQVTESDLVETFNGKSWQNISQKSESSKVILLYKPPRVMTTKDDPEKRKTVYHLIPKKYATFKTAGRLDFMSEGLLVLSENGHMILSMTHPKFKTSKKYLVALSRPLLQKDIQKAETGNIVIEGYKLNPVQIETANLDDFKYLRLEKNKHWYVFTLSEGKNRQIRKMATYFKNIVFRLIRIEHGPFKLSEKVYKAGFIVTGYLEG